MSWSVSVIGNPGDVVAHLDKTSATLTGQSKVEFDDALPHLKGLVSQTFNVNADALTPIDLEANGHGSADAAGSQVYRTINVSIKPFHKKVV